MLPFICPAGTVWTTRDVSLLIRPFEIGRPLDLQRLYGRFLADDVAHVELLSLFASVRTALMDDIAVFFIAAQEDADIVLGTRISKWEKQDHADGQKDKIVSFGNLLFHLLGKIP